MYGLKPKRKNELLQGINPGEIKRSKMIARSTVEYVTDVGRFIRYHETDVVIFMEGGTIVLNSGGWKTITTKERINKHINFYDDMKIKDGCPIVPRYHNDDHEKWQKLIAKYCRKLKKLKELPMPEQGDCWDCFLVTVDKGIPMGDVFKDNGHIISHIEEVYIFGSLIYNAMKWAGYADAGIGIYWQSMWPQGNKDRVISAVRRHLKFKLGMPH